MSNRKWLVLCLALLAAFAVVTTSAPLFGQAFYGSVVGTITDQSGAAVIGAAVTLANAGPASRFLFLNGTPIYSWKAYCAKSNTECEKAWPANYTFANDASHDVYYAQTGCQVAVCYESVAMQREASDGPPIWQFGPVKGE